MDDPKGIWGLEVGSTVLTCIFEIELFNISHNNFNIQESSSGFHRLDHCIIASILDEILSPLSLMV